MLSPYLMGMPTAWTPRSPVDPVFSPSVTTTTWGPQEQQAHEQQLEQAQEQEPQEH